ncbi:MAG: putative Serine/threonine-protein phosphatase [Streblomastix strix]|uniref:Serine/threonine-protein phosphatase n=1 Tax=Streblomastix strix TaxID=222440 RepID=A0A5J4UKV5_9EUKA|nr:MAG: putative Serine/threonine-protein phosphatase [Streblomastix strix]
MQLQQETQQDVFIFGDIHGNLTALLQNFRNLHSHFGDQTIGPNEDEFYLPGRDFKCIFLGDYVDRGLQSVEVLILLLAFKCIYPDKVILLRGNHENDYENIHFGFKEEVLQKYTIEIYEQFQSIFRSLPLCALVSEQIITPLDQSQSQPFQVFCVHGGLPGLYCQSLEYYNDQRDQQKFEFEQRQKQEMKKKRREKKKRKDRGFRDNYNNFNDVERNDQFIYIPQYEQCDAEAENVTLDMIDQIDRFQDIPYDRSLFNSLLWADPAPDLSERQQQNIDIKEQDLKMQEKEQDKQKIIQSEKESKSHLLNIHQQQNIKSNSMKSVFESILSENSKRDKFQIRNFRRRKNHLRIPIVIKQESDSSDSDEDQEEYNNDIINERQKKFKQVEKEEEEGSFEYKDMEQYYYQEVDSDGKKIIINQNDRFRDGYNKPILHSKRGHGTIFTQAHTEAFCSRNLISHLIRAHECCEDGYSTFHGGRCITIFSTPHYTSYSGVNSTGLIIDQWNKGATCRIKQKYITQSEVHEQEKTQIDDIKNGISEHSTSGYELEFIVFEQVPQTEDGSQ